MSAWNEPSAVADAGSPRRKPRRESGSVYSWERRLLRRLLAALGDPPVSALLWNDEEVRAADKPAVTRLHFHQRKALLKTLLDPDLYFGDEYAAGRIDIEGDLVTLLEQAFNRPGAPQDARSTLRRRHRNSPTGSRENIFHHYDVSNDFFRLWLDEQMVYTCAYFEHPAMSLEAAQVAKMDHVCRKLRLRPGERVVEAGCGWGALALHMASRYGVKVDAFNISHEQITYARDRARREGLDRLVTYHEADYRDIRGTYDAFVSVGMLEHVGIDNYATIGSIIDRCLTPRGRGLIHSIGLHRPMRFSRWLEARIFPGAEPPALSELLTILEPHDLTVLDVENLRNHYAQTLRHWLTRFENAADAITAMFDERFVRMWRFYLAGSLAAYTSGWMQLFQVLFNRRTNDDVPWNRAYLYQKDTGVTK